MRRRVDTSKHRQKLRFMSRDSCHLPASINSLTLVLHKQPFNKLNGQVVIGVDKQVISDGGCIGAVVKISDAVNL